MTKFQYYKSLDENVPTDITIGTMRDCGMSHDDIISLCGLAIMLKDAVLSDDGEFRAIAIRKIEELEDKIPELAYAISLQY